MFNKLFNFLLKKHLYIIVLFFCTLDVLNAQDVEYSQFFSLPLHLNPAMAGTANAPRFTLAYRNQWPSLGAGFNGGFATYAGGYDQHFEKIRSSIGLWVSSDRIANNLWAANSVSLAYAYQLRLNKKMGLRFALEGSYINRSIDWYQLLYGDQIDPLKGFYQSFRVPNATLEITPDNFSKNIFDMGLGALYFTNKYYAGVTVRHILRPKEAITSGDESRIPVKYSIHAGAIIPFKLRRIENIFLSPNIYYVRQKNFNQISLGLLLNVKIIYGGIWFRHNIKNSDAVIVLVGLRKGIFRVGYSYDITLGKLAKATGGSHELTMTFSIGKDDNSLNPKNRSGILSCPQILKF